MEIKAKNGKLRYCVGTSFPELKNFEQKEFDSPDVKGSGEKMNVPFLLMLDNAREFSGIPFGITSGYRTASHNATLPNSSSTSFHMKGKAVDISAKTDIEKIKIIEGLLRAGIRKIIIYNTHIHTALDTRTGKKFVIKNKTSTLTNNILNRIPSWDSMARQEGRESPKPTQTREKKESALNPLVLALGAIALIYLIQKK